MEASFSSNVIKYEIRKLSESEKSLLDFFYCPECFELLDSKILQCVSGHSFCEKCYSRLMACALCKGSLLRTRNLACEKLFLTLTAPCRNRSKGCLFMGKKEKMVSHESVCIFRDFRDKRYPFELKLPKCKKCNGGFLDLGTDCNKLHGRETSAEHRLVVDWIWTARIDNLTLITNIGKQTFLWKIKRRGPCNFHVSLASLGKNSRHQDYVFIVSFWDLAKTECLAKFDGLCCRYENTNFKEVVAPTLCNYINAGSKLMVMFKIVDINLYSDDITLLTSKNVIVIS